MGVRLYNPTTGQFLSPDPIDGGNVTSYTYPQDPINVMDTTGATSYGKLYVFPSWGGFRTYSSRWYVWAKVWFNKNALERLKTSAARRALIAAIVHSITRACPSVICQMIAEWALSQAIKGILTAFAMQALIKARLGIGVRFKSHKIAWRLGIAIYPSSYAFNLGL